MGLDVLNKEKLVADNVSDVLESRRDKWKLSIKRKHGHMFVEWGQESIRFTKAEIQKIHLHSFHANVQKLYNLLKRAHPEEVSADTRRTLEEMADAC